VNISIKINDNWRIKNNWVENNRGLGAKVIVEDNLFYFDSVAHLPNYIWEKVIRIYQDKGLKHAIDISNI
jgi:hypothetical protein